MRRIAFLLLLVMAPVYADALFTAHEGPAVFTGSGGEKTSVDGVDFWLNGASPPRTFKLLGYLTADINSAGLNGLISRKRLPGKIAKQAKELGGDAVIVLSEDTRTWTNGGTITAYGNEAHVNQKNFARTKTRYAIVQYLDTTDTQSQARE